MPKVLLRLVWYDIEGGWGRIIPQGESFVEFQLYFWEIEGSPLVPNWIILREVELITRMK